MSKQLDKEREQFEYTCRVVYGDDISLDWNAELGVYRYEKTRNNFAIWLSATHYERTKSKGGLE